MESANEKRLYGFLPHEKLKVPQVQFMQKHVTCTKVVLSFPSNLDC